MKLPFDNLISFHAVITHGSFSSGARKLGKSQSTVSGAVKSLEEELGYLLIDRSNKQVEPTERGKKIYQLSTPIINKYNELSQIAESLLRTELFHMRVGIDSLVFNNEVKSALIEFSEAFPEIELNVVTKPSRILGQYINNNQIDIAICNPYHRTKLDFNIDELFTVNCNWIVHRELIQEGKCTESRLLLLDGCEDLIDLSNVAKNYMWILDDISTILELCIAKKGMAFLPQHTIDNSMHQGVLAKAPSESALFGKQLYASLIWPIHSEYGKYHQWLHDKLRKGHKHF